MHIEFRSMGGLAYFPGLNKPTVIDSEALGEEEAAELYKLVDKACFFDLPPIVGTPRRGAADYKQYMILIKHADCSNSVQVNEPVDNAALKALIDFLKTKASK